MEAIRDAKRNAQTLAQAIGQQIGKCFYIYDSNNDVLPVFYNNAIMMRSMAADASAEGASEDQPLDFKTLKLQYYVQAKFVLE